MPTLRNSARSTVAVEKACIADHRKASIQIKCSAEVKRGLPVADFVHIVWSFTSDMIPQQSNIGVYKLSNKLLQEYFREDERKAYTGFAALLEDLLGQLYPRTNVPALRPIVAPFCVRKIEASVVNARAYHDEVMEREGGTRPDVTWTTLSERGRRSWRTVWEECLAFVEIKRPSTSLMRHGADIWIDLGTFGDTTSSADGPSNMTDSGQGKRKRLSSDDLTAIVNKRLRIDPSMLSYDSSPLRDEEFHAALYMNEMLSRSLRSFASGFAVNNTVVTLWYGDRMGLVASESFDFLKEPHKLVLVVAALGYAGKREFGFAPFCDGPKLTLPITRSMNGLGRLVPDMGVTFDVSRDPPKTRYEVVGKATMVLTVRASGNAEGIVGVGQLAAKRTWPLLFSPNEPAILTVVRDALTNNAPWCLKHITDVKCYIEQTMSEHGLPRALMACLTGEKERCFRLMVMKRYEPLENVAGPLELRKIFTDTVRAHKWVAEVANVLHGDISRDNLMFYREGQQVIGVLCDWDCAHVRDRVAEAVYDLDQPAMAGDGVGDALWIFDYRSGPISATPAFMDIERQSLIVVPHRCEHDLESFFWTIVDILENHNPITKMFREGGIKACWDHEKCARWKMQFLYDELSFYEVEVRVHSDYRALFNEWVPALRNLFWRIYEIKNGSPDEATLRCNLEMATYQGNEVAQFRYIMQLEQKVYARKKILSYESFMGILGEPLYVES